MITHAYIRMVEYLKRERYGVSRTVKAVVVGDKLVGKSSLINAFGIDENEAVFYAKGDPYLIEFTEKAGWQKEEPKEPKEPTNNGLSLYEQETEADDTINVQIIVYDVSNEESFDFINKWIYANRTDAPTILIANKCDLFPPNVVGKEKILSYGYCRENINNVEIIMELCAKYYGQKKTAQKYAKENNMEYAEISIKKFKRKDINALLQCISEYALAHKELNQFREKLKSSKYGYRGSFLPTIWRDGYVERVGKPPRPVHRDSIKEEGVGIWSWKPWFMK